MAILPSGERQVFVGRHFGHEVTSAPAFETLRERGLKVKHPELTFFTLDHVIPTDCRDRPFKDVESELMAKTLEDNIKEFGITYFAPDSFNGGVCHVIFPALGLIWPGQLIVCGDSHTCTYGALGALAFGIGTTQVEHVLATQTLAIEPLKVRRINFNGELEPGVTLKDAALFSIARLGPERGKGYVHEYGGSIVHSAGIEDRLCLCNQSVEGNARAGYVNPDNLTFSYLLRKPWAPREIKGGWERLIGFAESIASREEAEYDDIVYFGGSDIKPQITWGTNPSHSMGISEFIPAILSFPEKNQKDVKRALEYMGLQENQKLGGMSIDYVFIGSCTNGRLTDLKRAASIIKGRKVKVPTLVVPGSQQVKYEAEIAGLDRVFIEAGAEWRLPGCSMCLAMNPDKIPPYKRCVSTSNRNFENRQGPNSRTHLASPYTAAASAVEGRIADPRRYLMW